MIIKFKGQSWSNFIDWFFSCVKIFYQCERKFSINVLEKFQSMLEKFQSMLENFLSMLENFQSMRGNFLSMSENFQSMSENFPSMWAKNFNQWVIFFGRQRKKRYKTIFSIEQNYSFANYTNLIFRTFVHTKTKKRNWKKERFFIVLITKWLWLFRFLSKGKKQEKGEKRKKSKVCIFLL